MPDHDAPLSLLPLLDGAGVYGFAKSYRSEGPIPGGATPPYFFRGSGTALVTDGGDLRASRDSVMLSEELELVLVLSCTGTGALEVAGYTFGNDLTDLGRFRADPSGIMHAKAPAAAVCSSWWRGDPPVSLDVGVTVRRAAGGSQRYEARIGTDHLTLTRDRVEEAVAGFAGVDLFRTVLLFTGAPRGLAWAGQPVTSGDTVVLEVDRLGPVLANRVRCDG
ncbi:MAG: hypothetical protein QG608_1109 [Actinomycetota bacterium]|nr:hypothetical protein [Actinomycetota bacterium]